MSCDSLEIFIFYRVWVILPPFFKHKQTKKEPEVLKLRKTTDIASLNRKGEWPLKVLKNPFSTKLCFFAERKVQRKLISEKLKLKESVCAPSWISSLRERESRLR